MTNTSNWPREVIDIEQLKTVLDDNNINMADELDIVLRQRAHVDLPYGKRYQHVRFATILGAVYVPDSIYKEKEREKHLKKLRRYYDQNAKKSYIKLETAEFYCNFLDQIKDSIEQRHPGVKLPLISIDKPLEKQEHSHGSGSKKEKKTKTLNDKIVKIDRYQVINPSCLQKLSADELSKLLDEVFQKRSADLTSTADKDKLLNLISNIKYAFAYAQNDGKSLEQNSHLNQARRLYNYRAGQNLTPQTQKLYVTYMEAVEERLRNEHPDYQVVYDEIPLLYENNQPEPRPGPGPGPEPGPEPKPRPEPEPNNKILDGYTSDEWTQLLDSAVKTAVVEEENLTEGIAVTSLKEVLGKKFPDNFDTMSLDEIESEVLAKLNPAQIAQFNIKVTEKAQTLAECLPPHFLTFMAKQTDEALGKNGIDDDLKQTLTGQQEILRSAIKDIITQYHTGVVIDADNAAGVYDGLKEMLAYAKAHNLGEAEKISSILAKLEESIKEYDTNNGLDKVTENNLEAVNKAYDTTKTDVDGILAKSDWETQFTNILDDDTKEIFKQITFPETTDENGNKTPAEENKKLFVELILNKAAQQTACSSHDKSGNDLKSVLNEQIKETAVAEIFTLMAAEEAVKINGDPNLRAELTVSPGDNIAAKKQKLAAYISNKPAATAVSKDALAGYFAAAVNRQSLFANRLATKLNNRGAGVLKKMWQPFQKLDKTCINRFGLLYTVPRGIFKNSLQNLPWSALNAVARVAAFSQVGTPWGMACVAGYAAYSLGTTAIRMIRQYKKIKKQDKSMTPGKYLKNNWSAMTLSVVGTAVSVIPGLSTGSEFFKGGLDWMRNTGMLERTGFLGMTKASAGLIGAGMLDATIRGAKAHHAAGKGWFKSIGAALGSSVLSSAAGIGVGMGCATGANELLNSGMNLFGDVKTQNIPTESYEPDNPDHSKEQISPGEYDPANPSHSKEAIPTDKLGIGTAEDLTKLSPDELAARGLVREDASANEPGAFLTREEVRAYTTHDYSQEEHNFAEMRNSDPRFSEFLERYHVASDLQDSANPDSVSATATDKMAQAIDAIADKHPEMQSDMGNGKLQNNTQMLMYKLTQMAYLAPNTDAMTTDGIPVGEQFGYQNEDGSYTTYMDLIKEAVNDGKFSNPEKAYEVLMKIEDHVGGQLDNSVNDMGKVDMFGNQIETGRNVNSYQENDAGYTKHEHPGQQAEYEKISLFEKTLETTYMPYNPSIDLYKQVTERKEVLARVMGNHGRYEEGQLKPDVVKKMPGISQNAGNSNNSGITNSRKGNIFTRIFRRGGNGNGRQ